MLAMVTAGAEARITFVGGRYNAVGFLLFAAAFLILSLEQDWLRCTLTAVVGFFVPFAAIQLLPYGLLIVVLLRIWFRKRFDRESVCFGIGVFHGLLGLFALYALN